MIDPIFGELQWDGDDRWEGSATFEHFRGYGAALDEPDEVPPANGRAKRLPPSKRQLEAHQQMNAAIGRPLAWLVSGFIRAIKWWIDRKGKQRDEQPDAEELALRAGKVGLMVDAPAGEEPPTDAEREAWAKLLARRDAVWDELLEHALAVYNRQRPTRAWIWQATYGEVGLNRHLPELSRASDMKRLVRPLTFRVKLADERSGVADIGVHLACMWHVDGFGAVIRDGRVVEVGSFELAHPMKKRDGAPLEHPVFGTLRRIPDNDAWEVINQWKAPMKPGQSGFDGAKRGGPWPWEGRTPCGGFRRHALIADDRATFRHDPANAEAPRSAMAWEFAEGEFDLRVYADRDQPPGERQAAAFAAFRENESKHARAIVDAVFHHYQENAPRIRRDWLDHHVEELVPELASTDGLREHMQLRHIHVHPEKEDGRATIGFQFVCTWNSDGLGVRWRDGQVIKVGSWKYAEPKDLP